MKGRRVEVEKIRRLKASIPGVQANSDAAHNFQHFAEFPAASIQLKE